jgi:hypothetical protein
MGRAWCETSSWTCNSHCTSRCWGWCRTNTGMRRMLLRPLPRMGWCWGGSMRGERTEVEWRTRWWQLRREPSLTCGGIDGQIGRVCRAGPRHDPFNSVWAKRASCGAWIVASARIADPARHDFFSFYKKSYIHMYNIINTWAWCSTGWTTSSSVSHPSSIRVWVQTPTPAPLFNITHLLHGRNVGTFCKTMTVETGALSIVC